MQKIQYIVLDCYYKLIKNGSEATVEVAFGHFVAHDFSSLVKRAPDVIDRIIAWTNSARFLSLLSFASGVSLVITEIDWNS